MPQKGIKTATRQNARTGHSGNVDKAGLLKKQLPQRMRVQLAALGVEGYRPGMGGGGGDDGRRGVKCLVGEFSSRKAMDGQQPKVK